MLHYLDQPEHRADDPNSGSIPAGCLVNPGFRLPTLLLKADVQFHHASQFLEVGPVYRQAQGLAQERVLDGIGFAFERDDAMLASFGGVGDNLLDDSVRRMSGLEEYMGEFRSGAQQDADRGRDHDRSERASQDD